MKRFFLLLLLCLLSLNVHALTGWSTSVLVGSDFSTDLSSNIVNSNYVIHIDNTNTDFWSNIDNTNACRDLRITDMNDNLLNFQTESCDVIGDDAWIIVNRTSWTEGSTYVKAWVGNASPSDGIDGAVGRNVTSTYDSSYAGVWLFNQDTSGGAFLDSTSNNNDGTNIGTIDGSGQIDRGRYFDGVNDTIEVADSASLDISGAITFACWIKPDSTSGRKIIFQKGDDTKANAAYIFEINSGQLRVLLSNGSNWDILQGGTITTGTLQFVGFTWDGTTSANKMILYKNGSSVATGTASNTSIQNSANKLIFGEDDNQSATSNYFQGIIDHCSISNIERSAEWFAHQYTSGLNAGNIPAETTNRKDSSLSAIWTDVKDTTLLYDDSVISNNDDGNWILRDLGSSTYSTSSPEIVGKIYSTGRSTTFDVSTFASNEVQTEGSIQYQYRYHSSDCNLASWNGTWLSRSGIKSESDVTGQCIQFKYKLVSDGTQKARLDTISIVYSPFKTDENEVWDTYLDNNAKTTNYGNNAGPFLVGYDSAANTWGNYIITLMNHMIPNPTISNVDLNVYVEYVSGQWESSYDLCAYKLKAGNGNIETDATWNIRAISGIDGGTTSKTWIGGNSGADTSGTDFDATALSCVSLGSGFTSGYKTFSIPLSVVRSWRDNGQNAGIVIRTPDRTATHKANIYPSESTDNAKRPYFDITFSLDDPQDETPRVISNFGNHSAGFITTQWHIQTDDQGGRALIFWGYKDDVHIYRYDGNVWHYEYNLGKSYRTGDLVRDSNGYYHVIKKNNSTDNCGANTAEYISTYPDDLSKWDSPIDIGIGAVDKGSVNIDSNNKLYYFTTTTCGVTPAKMYTKPYGGSWSSIDIFQDSQTEDLTGTGTPRESTYTSSIIDGSNIYVLYGRTCQPSPPRCTANFMKSTDGGSTWTDKDGNSLILPLEYWDDPVILPESTVTTYDTLALSMIKIGGDIYLSSSALNHNGALGSIDTSNMPGNVSTAAIGGATGNRYIEQTLTATANDIGRFCINIRKVGSPTSKLYMKISGVPVSTIISASDLTTSFQKKCFDFPSVGSGNTPRIVVLPNTETSGNHFEFSTSGNSYSGGTLKVDGADQGVDLEFETYQRSYGTDGVKVYKLTNASGLLIDMTTSSFSATSGGLSKNTGNVIFFMGERYSASLPNNSPNTFDGNIVSSQSFTKGSTWSSLKQFTSNATSNRQYAYVLRNPGEPSDLKFDVVFNSWFPNESPSKSEMTDIYYTTTELFAPITPPWGWLDQLGSETIH